MIERSFSFRALQFFNVLHKSSSYIHSFFDIISIGGGHGGREGGGWVEIIRELYMIHRI